MFCGGSDRAPTASGRIIASRGLLVDGDGRPVCTEMWPGNTADVGSLIPVIDRLQRRFRIARVCVVALALILKKELEDRLAAADMSTRASWPAVLADLNSLTETEVEQGGKHFLLRSAPRPAASFALQAVGVALQPTLRQIAGA